MGSQRSILCSVPIMANNKDYNYETVFLLQSSIYWTHGTLPRYSMKMCIRDFYDVSNSLNFSHESIDITSIGLDKANTEAPFCIVMDKRWGLFITTCQSVDKDMMARK